MASSFSSRRSAARAHDHVDELASRSRPPSRVLNGLPSGPFTVPFPEWSSTVPRERCPSCRRRGRPARNAATAEHRQRRSSLQRPNRRHDPRSWRGPTWCTENRRRTSADRKGGISLVSSSVIDVDDERAVALVGEPAGDEPLDHRRDPIVDRALRRARDRSGH